MVFADITHNWTDFFSEKTSKCSHTVFFSLFFLDSSLLNSCIIQMLVLKSGGGKISVTFHDQFNSAGVFRG